MKISNGSNSRKFDGLRRKAEKLLLRNATENEPVVRKSTPDDQSNPEKLKNELENQTAELRKTQIELQQLQKRYFQLYETSPVGYMTLQNGLIIIESNLYTCDQLGIDKKRFIGSRFTRFITSGYQDTFHSHRMSVFSSNTRQHCEVELRKMDGSLMQVRLESICIPGEKEKPTLCQTAIIDITERKQAEDLLRTSEKRYRDLYEEAPNAYLSVGTDGLIQMANKAATELLGYSKEELPGLSVFKLYADSPTGIEKAKNLFQSFIAGEEISDQEMEMISADGKQLWVRLSVRSVRGADGKVLTSRSTLLDITEQKRTDEILRASENNYRTLVESSPDGILAVDMKGHILDCNKELMRLLGYPKTEIIGRDIIELMVDKLTFQSSAFFTQLIGNKLIEREMEMLRYDGTVIPVWAKAVTINDESKQVDRVLLYLRDITDRKKVDQIKDDFIGMVSHEISTPLTVIIGAINTARTELERLTSEEIRQLLQDAAHEAEYLSHLLGNLLELTKWQANRILLYPEPINVQRVVRFVIEKVSRNSKLHRFETDFPDKLPRILADETRLERILYNLLDNAAKYSPEGSKIQVTAKVNDQQLTIAVKDQGAGLSPEEQKELFVPFNRLDNEASDRATGTGLGLVVCQRLVEAHGGRLWIESKKGKGTTFLFTLPLDR